MGFAYADVVCCALQALRCAPKVVWLRVRWPGGQVVLCVRHIASLSAGCQVSGVRARFHPRSQVPGTGTGQGQVARCQVSAQGGQVSGQVSGWVLSSPRSPGPRQPEPGWPGRPGVSGQARFQVPGSRFQVAPCPRRPG
jgi:hypothetical protein